MISLNLEWIFKSISIYVWIQKMFWYLNIKYFGSNMVLLAPKTCNHAWPFMLYPSQEYFIFVWYQVNHISMYKKSYLTHNVTILNTYNVIILNTYSKLYKVHIVNSVTRVYHLCLRTQYDCKRSFHYYYKVKW